MQENSPDFTTINFEVQTESQKTISSGATQFFCFTARIIKKTTGNNSPHTLECVSLNDHTFAAVTDPILVPQRAPKGSTQC